MNNSDKTIPYRLSQAELENLRLLRRRTQPSDSVQVEETTDGFAEEGHPMVSNPEPDIQIIKKLLRVRKGTTGS